MMMQGLANPKVVKRSPCSSTLPRTVRSCRSAQECVWRDSQCDRNNRRNAGTVMEQPTANIAAFVTRLEVFLSSLTCCVKQNSSEINNRYRWHTCPRHLRNCLLTTWLNRSGAMSRQKRSCYTT